MRILTYIFATILSMAFAGAAHSAITGWDCFADTDWKGNVTNYCSFNTLGITNESSVEDNVVLSFTGINLSGKLENYGDISGTEIALGNGAFFHNYGIVSFATIKVTGSNAARIATGSDAVMQWGAGIFVDTNATLIQRVFDNGELENLTIQTLKGRFEVEILDIENTSIDLSVLPTYTSKLTVSGAKILLPDNIQTAPMQLKDSLDISNSTIILNLADTSLIQAGYSLTLFESSDKNKGGFLTIAPLDDLRLEIIGFDLDSFSYEFMNDNGALKLNFLDKIQDGDNSGGDSGNSGDDVGGEPDPKPDEPDNIPVVGDANLLLILNPIGDVILNELLDSATIDLPDLKVEIKGAAKVILDIDGIALKLYSIDISNSTLVLNISDECLKSIPAAGKLIPIFESDNNIEILNVSLQTNLSNFYTASLVNDEEDGVLGVLVEMNPNYSGEPGSAAYSLAQARSDYYAKVKIKNPDGIAVRRLSAAKDPAEFDRILLEFFHVYQAAALGMSSSVQRSLQSVDRGLDSEDKHYNFFAEALGVSNKYGSAYGINAGIGGIFSIYSALANMDYYDGRSDGKILGARLNPRIPLGSWILKGEVGYQFAWFEESKSSFGIESSNRLDIESKILSLSAEYKIPLAQSLSLSPIARYSLQESRLKSWDDELFFDRLDKGEVFSALDSGGKLQYEVCVVSACHYFGAHGLAGYDLYFDAPVYSYGAFAKISIDSDSAWLDLSISGERFGDIDSYVFGTKLRLVF